MSGGVFANLGATRTDFFTALYAGVNSLAIAGTGSFTPTTTARAAGGDAGYHGGRWRSRQVFSTTFMHSSSLRTNMSNPSGAWSSRMRCVMTKLGSISPRSIRSRSGRM